MIVKASKLGHNKRFSANYKLKWKEKESNKSIKLEQMRVMNMADHYILMTYYAKYLKEGIGCLKA